jgi:hemoglobin-like flavoprotein
MLAVIVEKIVTALAEPGARTHYDIVAARLIRSLAEVNGPISDEVIE